MMTIRWFLAAALAAAPVPLAAQAAPDSVEARMQRVEDNLAIRRILVDYAAFLDGRDFDAYVALFTPDGEWTNSAGSHKGQAAIRQMLEKTVGTGSGPNRTNYHLISNPRIDLDGDRATATSRYLVVMRGPDGSPTPGLAGVYRDELVRQDGEWKIRRRVADDIMPTPEEWRKIFSAQRSGQ